MRFGVAAALAAMAAGTGFAIRHDGEERSQPEESKNHRDRKQRTPPRVDHEGHKRRAQEKRERKAARLEELSAGMHKHKATNSPGPSFKGAEDRRLDMRSRRQNPGPAYYARMRKSRI